MLWKNCMLLLWLLNQALFMIWHLLGFLMMRIVLLNVQRNLVLTKFMKLDLLNYG